MKHSITITLILVAIFFVSQIVGLTITNQYIEKKTINIETGEVINITYTQLPFDMERPQVEESKSYIFILTAVLIGTILVLLLVKFKGVRVWKSWFFLSVALCLTVAFYAFFHNAIISAIIAIILAGMKIFKPNIIIHNITEIFIYGGLAAIFVPIMNVFSVVVLLLVISVYDMIAVWQSKHMIKMAMFQTESKVFAGLSIPYKMSEKQTPKYKENKKSEHTKIQETKNAILGGGDIGFPLLFAGVLMKSAGFLKVLIVPVIVTIALFLLLYYAKKDRFYPAMPFISAGCFVAYVVLLLL